MLSLCQLVRDQRSTMTDAEAILREQLDKILRKLNYKTNNVKIKKNNSDVDNYTATLFLITVAEGTTQELNLFAKVTTLNDQMREVMSATKVIDTECFVYEKLTKIYNELEDKFSVPEKERFAFPKFYGCSQELYKETIVLDNLVAKGYNNCNRFETIDWEYASAAVEALARLHALSFAFQKEKPEEFNRVVQKYDKIDEVKVPFEEMMKNSLEVLQDVDARNRVKKFLTSEKDLYDKFNRPISRPVLVHGDYKSGNLMYKKDAPVHQIIPVDYQTVYAGCPATDLVYFIFMGSDAAFRARHYDDLIEYYYQQLCSSMKRLGVDSTEVYPRDMFDGDLKEMLPYGVLIGVIVLPVVTVEAENAPRIDGEADVSGFCIKPNDIYTERFRGIVDDCIRWGVI